MRLGDERHPGSGEPTTDREGDSRARFEPRGATPRIDDIASEIATGLQAVYDRGRAHGDLAPEHIERVARELADRVAAALGSRYRLGERLGGGGMAEVFSATMVGAEGFARRVAIKRVLPGLSQVPAFAAMFVAEAQIASRLAHPNIVSVLDFARDADDRLYLVMEYVDGVDLASLLATGAIAPGLASFIMIEMLRGLGFAHGVPDPDHAAPGDAIRGVVHRDVSPQNLLLGFDGSVKVADFGLAKVRAASGGVRSDVVRGKPSYMSPEQVSGEPIDGRADLFAAGVMLWEMLADRPLFAGTAKEITAQVMFKAIPRPSRVRPGVPADLEAVAMTLLAHLRADRYPTAAAAIAALLGCADVPRDGRGELAALLAERFPGGRAHSACGAGGPRAMAFGSTATASAPGAAQRGEADGAALRAVGGFAAAPGRRMLVATLGSMLAVMALAGLAAGMVLARGEVAPVASAVSAAALAVAPPLPSQTQQQPVPPLRSQTQQQPVPPLPSQTQQQQQPLPLAPLAPLAPLTPPAAPPPSAAAPHAAVAGEARPPRRDRVARGTRTGELAIIVRPWALIWLNGKPSGQTPFRGPVPAGRYQIRIANDDAGRDEVTTVTVEPDRTATVERTW